MGGFQKAVKSQARLRLAMSGPSGSGKTYSALAIATGIGGRIALIDSERGSASKYADRFVFDTVDLETKSIDEYMAFIKMAGENGYNVLIIDSLSHAWQKLLEEVEKLAKARYSGNTWAAWSEGTPKQREFIDAILSCPCHIIATMRSKTEWQIGQDDKGRTKPSRVGLAPEQGKGIEYEFDILMEISPDHIASVTKDRTGKYQDKMIEKPGEDFGKELVAWLMDTKLPAQPRPITSPPTIQPGYVTPDYKALSIELKKKLKVKSEDIFPKHGAKLEGDTWKGIDWVKVYEDLSERDKNAGRPPVAQPEANPAPTQPVQMGDGEGRAKLENELKGRRPTSGKSADYPAAQKPAPISKDELGLGEAEADYDGIPF